MKLLYWVIILFVYSVILASSASAASLSLTIDPSIIEIHASASSATKTDITIQNKSNTETMFQIQLMPFRARLENGELEYLNNPIMLKDAQIMDKDVPVKNITLAPSQQKKLTLNISISEDTNISDYYFSIIFTSKNSLISASNASLNQLGIASNVLLSVGSREIPNAVIEEFSSNLFFEKGYVPFTIRIKNKGANFIKPKGEVLIKNIFGQIVGRLDLKSVNILSDTIRAIPNDLYMQELKSYDNSDSHVKSIDFLHPVALWKEDFLLGLYTATLNISFSDEGPILTQSTRFFAFPFQGLIMILIIAAVGVIIRNRVKRRMEKVQRLV